MAKLYFKYGAMGSFDVIIADESQFFTPEQIDELRAQQEEGIDL